MWLLVPVHELLHVAGCLASAGTVSRLEIGPLYGGTLFERVFPWVTSHSEYAGRLSGFQPAGDLSYLLTVLAPHLLLSPTGAAVARFAVRRSAPWLFGAALAAALQPLASLTGDCYEAASIPLTRFARLAGLDWALKLRGDDIFKVAQQATSLHSPLAWVLFAAGCVGGVFVAAFLLALSGGIAPRTTRSEGSGNGRRAFLRAVLGVVSLGAAGWILKRVFLPRRLRPSEIDTLAALLDTVIPDAESPGTSRTGVLNRLLAEGEAKRQTRRALIEGVRLLDRKATERGGAGFLELPRRQREEIVEECAQAEEGTVPRFLYRTVRDRAMELYYSQPAAWAPLRFAHPPQPEGYLDYWQKPDV